MRFTVLVVTIGKESVHVLDWSLNFVVDVITFFVDRWYVGTYINIMSFVTFDIFIILG